MSDDNIQRCLGTLEGKLDAMIEKMNHFEQRMEGSFIHHDKRIREMELKQSWVAGMAAAVGVAASTAYSWIVNHLK